MEISIHRALAELKLLNSRIENVVMNSAFCDCVKASAKTIKNKTIEEFKRETQGNADKIATLIARRNEIKRKIVISNATTYVTIGGNEMTVAEAIERKEGIGYEKNYLRRLKNSYNLALNNMEIKNNQEEEKCLRHIETLYGSKEKQSKDLVSEIETAEKSYMDRNRFVIVSGIKIEDIINGLEEEITNFETEVDAVLSESNAITKIDVLN